MVHYQNHTNNVLEYDMDIWYKTISHDQLYEFPNTVICNNRRLVSDLMPWDIVCDGHLHFRLLTSNHKLNHCWLFKDQRGDIAPSLCSSGTETSPGNLIGSEMMVACKGTISQKEERESREWRHFRCNWGYPSNEGRFSQCQKTLFIDFPLIKNDRNGKCPHWRKWGDGRRSSSTTFNACGR